jgi:hypothetical protein
MNRRPLKKLERKPVLRGEDLEAAVLKLRSDMSKAASLLAQETAVSDKRSAKALDTFPDFSELADAAIRGFLEEETLAVLEPEGPRGIAEHELHKEVIKKALVGLKGSVLREVARTRGEIG